MIAMVKFAYGQLQLSDLTLQKWVANEHISNQKNIMNYESLKQNFQNYSLEVIKHLHGIGACVQEQNAQFDGSIATTTMSWFVFMFWVV